MAMQGGSFSLDANSAQVEHTQQGPSTAANSFVAEVYQLKPLNQEDQDYQAYTSLIDEATRELNTKKPDFKKIENQSRAAVADADKIDRTAVSKDQQIVSKAIEQTTDPAQKQELIRMSEVLTGMIEAPAAARIIEGQADLAQGKYGTAHKLFEKAKSLDPAYANSNQIDITEQLKEAHGTSFWQLAKSFGVGALAVGGGIVGGALFDQ